MNEILSREEWEQRKTNRGFRFRWYDDRTAKEVTLTDEDRALATIEALAEALRLGVAKLSDINSQIYDAVRDGKRDEICEDCIAHELDLWLDGDDGSDPCDPDLPMTDFSIMAILRDKGWLR